MFVILFISVFEYTYFCFKLVFEYLPHSLPWPYFHIYIIRSLQVYGVVVRDWRGYFLSLEVDILKNGYSWRNIQVKMELPP